MSATKPTEAIEQLRNHQTQLDMDGITVGVSRQAIDEVLTYLSAVAAPFASTAEKALRDALETIASGKVPRRQWLSMVECIEDFARTALSTSKGRETCDAGAPPRPSTAEKALRETLEELHILHYGDAATLADQRERWQGLSTYEIAATLDVDARRALASPSTEGWRTIDSAPTDGTTVIVWVEWRNGGHWHPAYFARSRGWFVETRDGQVQPKVPVTHWQPMFSPPVPEQAAVATVHPEPKASTS